MDAALGFGLRHPLHPVDAAFVLQAAVGPLPLDRKAYLLDAPQLGFVQVQHLGPPAQPLDVHGVHPVEAAGKEGGLLAAGPGPYLDDDVLLVVGILGEEQQL